ncbi:sensor domain-containing diguanylate cyclase [Mycolicibacterium psychrotolerans]|uniref:sensor domain-containing diguanylate cyclase n=1 Tax=Mycolicibacterium psychrotolerans TaxID=216929 RepID=UPI003D67B600
MGLSANRWLAALAAAGVPAFHCRRADDGLTIVSRTPEFVGVMQALAGRLDECSLLSQLDDQWPPTDGDGPFTVAAAHDPAWQCALQPLDGDEHDHLAILSLPEAWQEAGDAFFSIVENLPDVVTRFDREFRYRYANPPMARLTGIPHETRLGRTQYEVGTSDELAGAFQSTYQQVFDTGEPVELEFDYAGPTGLRHYLGRATPEFDHDGQVQTVLSVVRDITELKRLQHQLEQLAGTDPLTSLLNRRSFVARLDTELARVRREQAQLSLLMLDLNNFKQINDRFGHAGGDQVLEAVGRILLSETDSHRIAARLGGDEFCIALIDTDEAVARTVAQRIGESVGNIALDSAEPIGMSASVGVAGADQQDTTALDLLARVDKLMYQVKFGGADETGSSCR